MGGLPKSVAGTTVIKGQKLRAADLRPGELHLVVFGPGSSEGIVVVLPDGDVGVVDGVGGDVIPMLLDELGIATMPATKAPLTSATGAKRLLFACLTHPHKDHYPGFAELIGTRQPQNLWWAGDEELAFFRAWCRAMKLIEGKRSHAGPKPPGWREVEDIQLAIENSFTRRPATRHRVLADRKRLLSVGEVSIDSVLPTTSEKREALKRLVGIDDLETAHRNSEAVNDLSGALIVKWGTTQLLLGGDCNTGSESDHGGWAGHGETLGEVQVVKVPHHGSHSSWHPESWADWKPAIGDRKSVV